METVIAISGPVPSMELWETDMRAIKLPYVYGKTKGGKDKKCLARLGVCPVRVYRLIHPEDQLEAVMALSGVGSNPNYVLKRYSILRWIKKILKKALGLKEAPIPSQELVKKYHFMQPDQSSKAVAVVPIGTKKDQYNDGGIEQL